MCIILLANSSNALFHNTFRFFYYYVSFFITFKSYITLNENGHYICYSISLQTPNKSSKSFFVHPNVQDMATALPENVIYIHNNGSSCTCCFLSGISHHWEERFHRVCHLRQNETLHQWRTPTNGWRFSSRCGPEREREEEKNTGRRKMRPRDTKSELKVQKQIGNNWIKVAMLL